MSQEALNGDSWYDISAISTTAIATVTGPAYVDGSGNYVTDGGYAGDSYVPLSFQYEASPAAATGTLSATITSPASGASLSGTSVQVTVSTSGSFTSLQLQVDGNNFGSAASSGPITLDTTTLINGQHTLTVVASQGSSASATSPGVIVTVNNAATTSTTATTTPFTTSQASGVLRNNYAGFVGMNMQVGAAALSVTSLGRMAVSGNTGTHLLKLVQANGTDVSGGSVAVSMSGAASGQFVYGTLTSPVSLLANTSYYLVSQETTGGDYWYDIAPVKTTSVGTVTGPVYVDGHGNYITVGDPGGSYVPLSFLYAAAATTTPTQTSSATGTAVITSPASNSVLGGVVTLTAAATPATGDSITSVQFQYSNINIGGNVNGAGPNFSVSFDTRPLENGIYSLSAIAHEASGNAIFGPGEGITIYNNIAPPTVSVTTPASGSAATGVITVTAVVTPASGATLASVQLQVDGQNFGAACVTTTCTAALDTTLLPNGKHQIIAAAVDSHGGHAVSSTVLINVNNAVTGVGVLNGYLQGAARNSTSWLGCNSPLAASR